ncbi:hypothetical protein FZ041_00805 [Selenomonas caprae]|uniref:Uncharacterized protein n=1 Tax=Selenomonas caprae TaxID=2606905 RepID=A0A5D6WXT6_9FIRM|nr:hypothetical protein [Selenomonas caprae]TYZ31084.1 hypothetical protein FZ041_00805 [Selenomonas caprae]
MKMRWGAGLLAAALLFAAAPQADAEETISEEIYQWVQSTARQNYYFNKQHIYFGKDEKGNINLDILTVPVLKTYDSIQIQDVVSKRRWKGQSTVGYGDLAGCAEYLLFHVKEQTVEIVKHEDLDSDWGTLGTTTVKRTVKIADLSEKDVDAKFYHAILEYAEQHGSEIAARTEKEKGAKLTKEAQKQLEKGQQTDKDGKDAKKNKKEQKKRR